MIDLKKVSTEYPQTMMTPWLELKLSDDVMKHLWKSIEEGEKKPQCMKNSLAGNISTSFALNDEDNYFVTSEHPFKTTDGWKSINPYDTKLESEWLFNELTGNLDVGTTLLTSDGDVKLESINEKEMDNPDLPLYNFHLDGNNSYYANDYLVHNKGGVLIPIPPTETPII